MTVKERLFEKAEEKYAAFQSKLLPTLPREKIIGVRVPVLRRLAKELSNSEREVFLQNVPHSFYDENMLHSILLSDEKDFEKCLYEVERFLPYIDNWAVCDVLSPKVFKRHKRKLLTKLYEWMNSVHTYTCRFAVEILMTHFLDEDFSSEILERVASIHSDEYYVNMMLAWFFAEALSKQKEAALFYLENKLLDSYVHNKTIQKALESRKIPKELKNCLRLLKIS